MSEQNENMKPEGGQEHEGHKHTSWLKHVVDEIKEEIEELTEEAQTSMNDGGFSVVGDGHINVVHDHHHHDQENKTEEVTPTGSKKPEDQPHHQSWIGHVAGEIKEEINELTEEAQTTMNDGTFSALGNGHLNVVHDHRKHDEEKKEE